MIQKIMKNTNLNFTLKIDPSSIKIRRSFGVKKERIIQDKRKKDSKYKVNFYKDL